MKRVRCGTMLEISGISCTVHWPIFRRNLYSCILHHCERLSHSQPRIHPHQQVQAWVHSRARWSVPLPFARTSSVDDPRFSSSRDGRRAKAPPPTQVCAEPCPLPNCSAVSEARGWSVASSKHNHSSSNCHSMVRGNASGMFFGLSREPCVWMGARLS